MSFVCQNAHCKVLVDTSNPDFEIIPPDRVHSPVFQILTPQRLEKNSISPKTQGWVLKMFKTTLGDSILALSTGLEKISTQRQKLCFIKHFLGLALRRH